MKSCVPLLDEMQIYRRDENGKIVKKDDHLCLAGDTEIITDKGIYKIEDLVGTTGKIVNRYGQWEDYSVCAMTGEMKETITLQFDDRSSIRCTPNHQFLTPHGWIEALFLKDWLLQGGLKVTEVVQSDETDVYCLYVPKTHSFTLSNGIISKNCDALRYLVHNGLGKMKINPRMYELHGSSRGANYAPVVDRGF